MCQAGCKALLTDFVKVHAIHKFECWVPLTYVYVVDIIVGVLLFDGGCV